jgi:hypothetical protein
MTLLRLIMLRHLVFFRIAALQILSEPNHAFATSAPLAAARVASWWSGLARRTLLERSRDWSALPQARGRNTR